MKKYQKLWLVIILISSSILMYSLYYVLAKGSENIMLLVLSNLAFIPIELLLVTLVLDHLLNWHERSMRRKNIHLTVGVFFYEVGTKFLEICRGFEDENPIYFSVDLSWTKKHFINAKKHIEFKDMSWNIQYMNALQKLLLAKRDFLLGLMQNSNLLEEETFTSMIWSIFHLADEMGWRGNLSQLNEHDKKHLMDDVKRAYPLAIKEWLTYMQHLQQNYAYLFGLAAKNSPFIQPEKPKKKKVKRKACPRTY